MILLKDLLTGPHGNGVSLTLLDAEQRVREKLLDGCRYISPCIGEIFMYYMLKPEQSGRFADAIFSEPGYHDATFRSIKKACNTQSLIVFT